MSQNSSAYLVLLKSLAIEIAPLAYVPDTIVKRWGLEGSNMLFDVQIVKGLDMISFRLNGFCEHHIF